MIDCMKLMPKMFDSLNIEMGIYSYPDMIPITLNARGLVRVQEIIGTDLSEEEIMKQSIRKEPFCSKPPFDVIVRLSDQAVSQTRPISIYRDSLINNELRYVRLAVAPLIEDGSTTKVVVASQDVTEGVAAVKARDELLAICSHELKTPLTVLAAGLDLFESSYEKMNVEHRQNYVKKFKAQVKRLDNLTKDLLDFSSLGFGILSVEMSPVRLDELVKATICEFESHTRHAMRLGSIPNCIIQADSDRITQALYNLLSNAARFSDPESEIIVEMEVTGDSVTVSVQDFGEGIPSDKINILFSRYYHVYHWSEQPSGMGLGLYIANEITKAHGGRITVMSELGKGSTFKLVLPR